MPNPNPPAAAQKTISIGLDDGDRRAAAAAPGKSPAPAPPPAKGPHGGFIVTKVEKFSSAAKAGIVVGDEIVAVNDKKVGSVADVSEIAKTAGIGGSINVELIRAGNKQKIAMKLFEKKGVNFDLGEVDTVLERKIAPSA